MIDHLPSGPRAPFRRLACALLAAGALAACNSWTSETGLQTVEPVALAPELTGDVRVGGVVFLAGFEIDYGARFFGGLSGLWVSPDGNRMVAVTDHGDWVSAPLTHDASGRLTGVGSISMAPLTWVDAEDIDTIRDPVERDAEGLALLPDGRAVVSFERRHRIWVYDRPLTDAEPLELEPPEGIVRLKPNGGIESVASLPGGRLLVIAEGPISTGTIIDMWVLEQDGTWRPLSYQMVDGFEVTDAAALPDGRVIVLERWFAAPGSLRIRLRELTPEQIDGTGIVEARLITELTQDMTIDNFEGMSIRQGPSGETLLYLISDDNFNALQSTYLYQFRLEP